MKDLAYNEGYAAHLAGEPHEANPYGDDTDDGTSWWDGWEAAEADEASRLAKNPD